jgi:hypothetical protein
MAASVRDQKSRKTKADGSVRVLEARPAARPYMRVLSFRADFLVVLLVVGDL